ncbi:MAG: hypothetical protein FJX18_02945 [Alphaproteobacteria bacterium]|nr:hypothetical protein [Alphaproteobacteria bacterium]
MGRRFLTEDEKKLWEEVNKTITPLKTDKKILPPSETKAKREKVFLSASGAPTNQIFNSPGPLTSPKEDLIALDRKTKRKIRSSALKIEGRLDLHGLTQNQAYDRLVRFMTVAVQKRYKLILVITGKGVSKKENSSTDEPYGVLRKNVPFWLSNKQIFPFVQSVSVANIQDGGEGALYVFLKT